MLLLVGAHLRAALEANSGIVIVAAHLFRNANWRAVRQ